MLKRLQVDEKWSILYDPDNNDIPVAVQRYREKSEDLPRNNWITAMFYALLAIRSEKGTADD